MNNKQIIGLIMAKTGESVSVHAAKSGLTPQAWYDVIKGRTKTPELRCAIAKLAETPESELWPDDSPGGRMPASMNQEKLIGKKVATVAAGSIITTTIVAINSDDVQVVAELETGAVVPVISLLVLQ